MTPALSFKKTQPSQIAVDLFFIYLYYLSQIAKTDKVTGATGTERRFLSNMTPGF